MPVHNTNRTLDAQLQERLGHKFARPELLVRALTHSSAVSEARAGKTAVETLSVAVENNEQLEFLGDAVLGLLTSEYLLAEFPAWSEGQLSKSRSRFVNSRALEAAARRLQLGEHLRLGRGEEKTGGRQKPAILADTFEALVAAVYLDAGLPAARQLLQRTLFAHTLEEGGERIADSDRKSALQELLQKKGKVPAEYRVVDETGPDHQKVFYVEVWADGECLASAHGNTKKQAEQEAAAKALLRLDDPPDSNLSDAKSDK